MSAGRVVTFLAVVLTLTVGLHYSLWARLVRDPGWRNRRGLTIALIAGGASIPLAIAAARLLPHAVAAPFVWIGYVWLGLLFFLFLLLLPAEIVRLAARVGGPPDPERRRSLARLLAAGVAVLAGGLGATGIVSALGPVSVKRVRPKVPRLPKELSGFRIVQLTDIHVGPTIGRGFVEDLVRRANALEPDLVAITGDLVDGTVPDLAPLVEPLRELRARHGVFFVTGNHEYYSGADAWVAHLRTLGIRVLRNERVSIERDGHAFDLVGVDDASARGRAHGPDLPRALAGRDPSRAVVLLAHQPKDVFEAAEHGVSLQLSGHTHGGQLFPFNFFVHLQQPFVAGLDEFRGTTIYVSRGAGYWGPPMRVGAPPEITHLELVSA
jgi:predicted MPP superfamily phosphohydrolase